MASSLNDIVPAGVVTGDDLIALMEHARANKYAIPAVNCTRYVPFGRFFVLDWKNVFCARKNYFLETTMIKLED
jgi:hypothetical protein